MKSIECSSSDLEVTVRMEFNRKNLFSHFHELQLPGLISNDDIKRIICNSYLLEKKSHSIVTEENCYDDSIDFRNTTLSDRVKYLEQAYFSAQTLVIKNLEHWSSLIKERCYELGGNPDVHLYLTPAEGTSFGWHADDRDVFIYMQIGEKLFEVEEPDTTISRYLVTPGSRLFIPYGARHRAIPSNIPSAHLSFGVWPSEIEIKSEYPQLSIPTKISV